ncbi:MAG TPA: hypothetical protein VFX79_03450 [Candidatus Saccharimonadales bacterium]|nr:hypothetical protein [Candidatus Saccharimonadales bacterium]
MSSTWVTKEINTGQLEVDGESIGIRVQHRASVSPQAEWDEVMAGNGNGYSSRRAVSLSGLRTDKGTIVKEIGRALKDGREVTAETEKHGKAEFKNYGPFVVGYTEHQQLQSVGRFGLGGLLGLK